jgi:hypothetical protein
MGSVPRPVNDQNKADLRHFPERAQRQSMSGERADIPLVSAGGAANPPISPSCGWAV